MFKDRDVASSAIASIKVLFSDLDKLLIELEPIAPPEEYKQARRAVGSVMAEVFELLAEPMAAGHPELRYWA